MIFLFSMAAGNKLPRMQSGGSLVKNPPAMQETLVGSLNQEDPLRKGMATHFSILAWRILLTEATVHKIAKSQTQLRQLSTHNIVCCVLGTFL